MHNHTGHISLMASSMQFLCMPF